jgi:hypothetical protein
MQYDFNGLNMNLGNLSRLSNAKTRSISAENTSGEKGKGGMAEANPNGPSRELGKGWKCSPCKGDIKPNQTYEFVNIEGPGAIQSMWMAACITRDVILRIYWDHQETPSVEVPLSDFFSLPWVKSDEGGTKGPLARVNSLPVSVNANRGCNCFWEMPFKEHCRMTITNIHPKQAKTFFYQVNYTLTEIPDDCAYFHASFRRTNPVPYKVPYTIIDGIKGKGQYIGTSMGWAINNEGWWGEGEIKFFIDGDDEYPTICGTGTEDYFGGAYNWEVDGEYCEYNTPFMGMQVIKPDGLYKSQHRHSLYRWHVMDPVRFDNDMSVTIQSLGWRDCGRYYPGQHDISSVAYWYQTLPTAPFLPFPDRNDLEIV